MSRYVTLSGLNTGQWMFAIRFENAETWAKAMTAVRASPEFKQWTAENKAAGNVCRRPCSCRKCKALSGIVAARSGDGFPPMNWSPSIVGAKDFAARTRRRHLSLLAVSS